MVITDHMRALVEELQHALGVPPIDCGHLTLNFNEHAFRSFNAQIHVRMVEGKEKHLDRPRRRP